MGVTNSSGSSWQEIDLSATIAGQVASNITFTPYGQIGATNVQDAIQELETEKLALAGGTVTGQVLFNNTATLVFEGSTVDAYETTLGVVDPTTADKTILLPNTSGTLITNNDSGTVTSAMLADGTIVNADINAAAGITLTRLEGITAAKIIVGNGSGVAAQVSVTGDISISDSGVVAITANSIVDGDISGSAAITGSKVTTGTTSAVGVLQLTDSAASTSATTAATPAAVKIAKDAADAAATTANAALPKAGGIMTGNLILDNASELRFTEADSDGANYTALKAQAQASDITLTLPATAPTANQVLKANASTPTTLEWATDTTNTAAADITGTTLASNVVASSLTSVGTLTSLTVSGTITGDVTGDLTGNADTATILATARTIGGVSFNGSANIDLPGVNTAGNQNTTGNAATATALATARTIGGVSFDGTANINLAGVNTAGTQDTSGTAALATQFTVTANDTTNETVYPIFVDAATGSQGAETDSALTYNPSTGALTTTTFTGNLVGNVTGNVTGNTSGSSGTCTGNAATATALETARTIGGVSFDGTGNINLAGVNTTGNQDTTGNAATFTATANNSTNETVYPVFVDGATGSQGAETDTGLSYNPSSGALTATSFVGALTGNAATATILATARDINGVSFNGSADITITAAAGTLSGATLASGVTASSLTSVGILTGLTTSGDVNLNAQADLRFKDADSSHYVALQAAGTIASSYTLTLPSADAAVSGYVLASDGSGTLSWVDPGSTSSPTFTGDVSLTNDGSLVGFSNLNGTYTGNAKTLTVTVASKTGAHRYNGSGSSAGYKIDGKESPFITLTPGRTYKFDQADGTNSGHPLRFYLEADKTTAYTTGVTTNGTAGSSGAYTQIVVSDTTPSVLHYQCSAHAMMGNAVQTNSNVAAAGVLTGATLASNVTASSLTSVGTLGSLNVTNNVVVGGNLTVNGTTTTVSSTTVEVADKNIELGKVASPSDSTADGGGITLDAGSDGDKTWNWVNSTDAWTSSEHIDLASGKVIKANGTQILSSSQYTGNAATATNATNAATVTGAAQTNITSLGTLSALTVAGNLLFTGTGMVDLPSGTTAQRPGGADRGAIRYNSTLEIFEGYDNNGWSEFGGGGGATGAGGDKVFLENGQSVTASYTLTANTNASSVGPLTINSGVTVTIPANAIWAIL